jgi:hypothetical protein
LRAASRRFHRSHTLDAFRGTLIFDEADFRFSDERSEIVKILNNGNVRADL